MPRNTTELPNSPKIYIIQILNYFLKSRSAHVGIGIFIAFFSLNAQVFVGSETQLKINQGTIFHADSITYNTQEKNSAEEANKIYVVKGTIISNFSEISSKTEIIFIDVPDSTQTKSKRQKTKESELDKKIVEVRLKDNEQKIHKAPIDNSGLFSGRKETTKGIQSNTFSKKHLGLHLNEVVINNFSLFEIKNSSFQILNIESSRFVFTFRIRPPPII